MLNCPLRVVSRQDHPGSSEWSR